MQVTPRKIVVLELDDGRSPFDEWCMDLNSEYARAIDARLVRIRDGNFGDHKSVGDGVFELRIFKGAGLRIYYGLEGAGIVVILGGGEKGSQKADIKAAKQLWARYKNED